MRQARGTRFSQAVVIAVLSVLAMAASAQATDYTWTGAGSSSDWGNGANWQSGLGPSGTVGALIFPQLTSPACTASPPTATCYQSSLNSSNGLAASSVSIDDNEPYIIGTGYSVALGSGGLTTTPDSAAPPTQPATWAMGIVLTAPQTWSIDGGSQQQDGLIINNGFVTGQEPLTVDFENGGTLEMPANVGPLTLSGVGTLIPTFGQIGYPLNGDGNLVTVGDGAQLWTPYSINSSVGPLSVTDGGDVLVGAGSAPDGKLNVNGELSLAAGGRLSSFIDQTGTTPVTDYSTVGVSGNVGVTGASLDLAQGANSNGYCVDLNPGDVDTVLTDTNGTISGTFAGVPDGAVTTIENECDNSTQSATATINYTATTVTATILSGGNAGDAPQSTAAPTIAGTPIVGQPLTASPGSWAGNPAFSYQWYRCTTSACSAISGATSSTYVPATTDVGDELFTAVTGANSAGSSSNVSDPTAAIKVAAPTNTAPPGISGTTTVGDTLTATPGTWSGSPTAYGYQWMLCGSAGSSCTAISGATAATYVLTSADVGDTVDVAVTATNATGKSAAVSSPLSAVIAAAAVAPVLVTAPVLSGNAVVGQVLSSGSAQFTGSPLSYVYGWELCRDATSTSCAPIHGATTPDYTVTSADAGQRLRFVEAAYNTAADAAGVSQPSGVVVTTAQVKAGLVALLGSVDGSTKLATVLKINGYSAQYVAPGSGQIVLTWTAKAKGQEATIATFKKTVPSSGLISIRVKLTAAGKRLLRQRQSGNAKLRVNTTISFTLPDAAAITATKSRVLEP